MTILYGIKNCDTVKKARSWLDDHGVAYRFHDFRNDGLEKQQLIEWSIQLSWEVLLNRRSTTWRQLPDEIKDNLDKAQAIELMLQHPTLIKRPLLEREGGYCVGFKDVEYQKLFD